MSGVKSLTLAIEVATRKRDQADQALMQALRTVQYAQGQLDQLQGYAADNEVRWATAAATTVRAELMLHHRQFTQRLQQTIELQSGVMADLQRQAEAARQRRLQEELRLAALEQLLKKQMTLRARVQARREQKQMDEMAMLQHARALGGLKMGEPT